MSKQVKRKITVNLSPKVKGLPKSRPSVFERLGTKAGSSQKEFCHHWAQNGTCPYGKSCKYSATHTLISPSKQRLAKTQTDTKKRQIKDNVLKRGCPGNPDEDWEQWDPEELEDADPDDLEKRRLELQRELELQMKMDNKAHKKQKKIKKESSPSSESSSSSSESSSSSDESSSSSSSSIETRRKKNKKPKKRDSSSSSEREKRKPKNKLVKHPKSNTHLEKIKKTPTKTKVHPKSPTPMKTKKLSQTPPPKLKVLVPIKKASKSESKSPRPISRLSDRKDKHRTPSPKSSKDKERDREREKEKDREKEREKEREKDREREKERERDREREREKERLRAKEREKEKRKERSPPKRDSRPPVKDLKKKDSPDSSLSRDRKASPSRSRGSTSSSSRRDTHKSPPKDKRYEKRADSRGKDVRKDVRKDKRDSRDRERDRERERRLAREEREAAREKEREEALARCQERQRERERLKELAKKEEEQRRAKERSRREDRGLDKPSGDRVERLLPLPQDRVPPARKESIDKDRQTRDRDRRSPIRQRSRSKKSAERIDKERIDRSFDRNYDRDHERDYHLRLREDHRHDDKRFESPYDRARLDERGRYMDIDHYNEDHINLDRGEFCDERRARRDVWDDRERELDRELEHRRYREDSRPPAPIQPIKPREWGDEFQEHEWERNRRGVPLDWEAGRENWDNREHEHNQIDEEWRHYNRSMDSWSTDDRRRWNNDAERNAWKDREVSRPRSSTSHREEEPMQHADIRRKEPVPILRQEPVEQKFQEVNPEPMKEVLLGKRPADNPIENVSEPKKPCLLEEPLVDDLSEISDDADEILNRDEELTEVHNEPEEEIEQKVQEPEFEQLPISCPQKLLSPQHSSLATKEDSIEEENMDLDFEEISEDELEEEARIKGLGDALGVDWASLVAESRPRIKPVTSAKRRWESHNILVNSGISIHLAGEDIVCEIYKEHELAKLKEETEVKDMQKPFIKQESGGVAKVETDASDSLPNGIGITSALDIKSSTHIHPIAAMQVAIREHQGIRKTLFASAGPYRRALSARRDLIIRRHLCNLPIKDSYVEPQKKYDPELFKIACNFLERTL